MAAVTEGERGVAAIAGAAAFHALAGSDIAVRLAPAAARIGEASPVALEVGGAGRCRRRAIAVGDALNALALAAGADGRAGRAMAVAHARHAELALGIAERMVGAGAIGVGDAHHARSAGWVALRVVLTGDGASRSAGNVASVIAGGAGVDRGGAIVIGGADGASPAHAPRLGGRARAVIRALHASDGGVA